VKFVVLGCVEKMLSLQLVDPNVKMAFCMQKTLTEVGATQNVMVGVCNVQSFVQCLQFPQQGFLVKLQVCKRASFSQHSNFEWVSLCGLHGREEPEI
jgi:hypothetical protein